MKLSEYLDFIIASQSDRILANLSTTMMKVRCGSVSDTPLMPFSEEAPMVLLFGTVYWVGWWVGSCASGEMQKSKPCRTSASQSSCHCRSRYVATGAHEKATLPSFGQLHKWHCIPRLQLWFMGFWLGGGRVLTAGPWSELCVLPW